MRKAANTLLIVASGLVLFSSMAFAKSATKDSGKDEHHSKMAKVAFWRHHKTADNNTKQTPAHKAVTKSQPKAKASGAKVTPAKASESHPKVMPAKQTAKPKQTVKSQQSKTEHKESPKAKTAKPAAKEKE